MKHFKKLLAMSGVLLFCMSCTTPIQTYYASTEEKIETRFGTLGDNGLYHDALYAPDVIALNFDGYIVGLDKSPRPKINAIDNSTYKKQTQQGMTKVIARLTDEPKSHYISHILHNTGKPYGDGNCYLYSIYKYIPFSVSGEESPQSPSPLANPCDNSKQGIPEYAFQGSYDATEILISDIKTKLAKGEKYSHVIFITMGWNTPQIESIKNFNSIIGNIRKASISDNETYFHPLFIGITWSSYWDTHWFDDLVQLASYTNKAGDADEVGASWLGYIIEKVSINTPGIPKVAIGHSFGARAISMAVCMGNQFNKNASPTNIPSRNSSPQPIDLLVGLQPAVSINRFLEGGGIEGIEYSGSCQPARKIVLTASSHDEAVKSAIWANMIGSEEVWNKTCQKDMSRVKRHHAICAKTIENGSFNENIDTDVDFIYANASKMIFFNYPNTGGGAHSDIYRPEIGKFIWHWMPGNLKM